MGQNYEYSLWVNYNYNTYYGDYNFVVDGSVDEFGCPIQQIIEKDRGQIIASRSVPHCIYNLVDIVCASFDPATYLSPQCLYGTSTFEANTDILKAYQATISQTSYAKYVENGVVFAQILMNYTGQTGDYNETCFADNGDFRSLDFEAQCIETDASGKTTAVEYITTMNFPRCYSTNCTSNEDFGLFKTFTLEATEARSRDYSSGTKWTCEGSIQPEPYNDTELTPVFCDKQTEALEKNTDIDDAWDLVAVERGSHALFSFITAMNVVNQSSYKSTCESNGGLTEEIHLKMRCKQTRTSINRVKTEITFETDNFPVCRGYHCDVNTSDVTYKMDLEGLLRKSGDMAAGAGLSWVCVVSSAFSAAVGTWAIAISAASTVWAFLIV